MKCLLDELRLDEISWIPYMYRLGANTQRICSTFAAFLRHPCDKNATLLQGVCSAVLRPSKTTQELLDSSPNVENRTSIVRASRGCLAAALRAFIWQQPCDLKKTYGDRKENLVFDVATALQPANFVRISKNVLRLPHETQRFPPKCGPRQVYGRRRADVKEALNTSCSFI